MNTPSHVIFNLAILINPQSISQPMQIFCGAVLPDLPMFLLYFWAKFIRRLPERQIWTETYYEPFWQNLTHTFHSIHLALIGWLVAYYFCWQEIQIIFSSIFLHSLWALPVHKMMMHIATSYPSVTIVSSALFLTEM